MVYRHFTNEDFVNDFIYIIKKGKKDNTYKFALAKFLIDYANKVEYLQSKLDNNTNYIIEYSTIAREILKILLASDNQIQNKAKLQYGKTTTYSSNTKKCLCKWKDI